MKMTGVMHGSGRYQIFIHQINVMEPLLLNETPESRSLDHVAGRPEGIREKTRTKIYVAEMAF
jgi:hypothetical protein